MDDMPQPEEAKLVAEAPEQDAIRGAFLARVTHTDAAAGGGFESGAATDAMRGAYLRHLGGTQGGAVVGDESGDRVLRSIYASRTAPAATPVRKGRARPAKAAKKKRAAASRPRPAMRKTVAKRATKAKRAKPAKRAKKSGRKMRRR